MSEPALGYMTGTADEFDLPRWQTQQHLESSLSSSTQSHANNQQPYLYSALPPPPQSLTAGPRLPPLQQSSTGSSRQPRINHLLEHDHQLSMNVSPYLSSTQNQLSRSASLGGSTSTSTNSVARGRRHHQPDDLEGAFVSEHQVPPPLHHQANAFYPPSVGAYHPQSLTAASGNNSSPSLDYQDMYFTSSGSNPPKRSNTTSDSSTSRSGRSTGDTPNGNNNHLDPYSQQAQYSPTSAPYGYAGSSDQRNLPSSTYQSHSRSQSLVKSEPLTPPISSPYKTHISVPPTYTTYAMDTSSPNPTQQTHMNNQLPGRQNSVSTPNTPLSYNHPTTSPGYYQQDQRMSLEVNQQKRRASGLVRIRDARDLRPRVNSQLTNRRMDASGIFLSPLRQLTTSILDTYHICNPQFRYESNLNPRRVLTKPSKPAHNDGYDNEDYDYILYVNDWLGNEDSQNRYLILDILGQGTFGQVVKCQNIKTHEVVAVKVVKNKPAYFNQSMMEVTILEMLNKTNDPNDEHHILRLRDSFIHRSHLCLVFELLSSNLYELIKQNQFQGLSTQLVKVFMAQLLDALTVLKEARLIHCDLKPENILLKSLQSPQIKVIDFGSACHERQTVYTYIQSRFYRSPEVLLGMPYTASIDMWSLGCIAVELFLGLPLFPGTSEYNQITRIVEMLGMAPLSMLNAGKQTGQFFDSFDVWNPQTGQNEKKYRLKSIEQYSREHNTNEQPGKQYFKATSLPEIIKTAPFPSFRSSSRQGHEMEKELNNRASFIDFCQGLLDMNPVTRWTPQQARLHPFITGEKWTKPFQPDGIIVQQVTPIANTDPKRPYGGLVPSQPKGTRAYQDAATYNHQLAQHQAYTAQAQAASQAASNAFRNPYIAQQAAQAPPQSSYSSTQEANNPGYSSQQPFTGGGGHPPSALRGSSVQYSNPGSGSSNTLSASSYYPISRARANTINQVDTTVPPALARLQHMNQDVISGGRNALTPVLNRDDAMREWERRQSGKAAAAQPYPQLEYLQQQAELAASSGMNWAQPGNATRYPPPSKLSHSYNPQTIMMDEDGRRDAVMSNVRSAARDGTGVTYNSAAMISSPPQAYNSPSTTSGNRYAASYTQQQVPAAFDPLDRRTDIGNMFVPMQPDQFQTYGSGQNVTSRHVAPPAQTVAPSFYGAGVVPSGPSQQARNPFSVGGDGQQQGLMGGKDNRRGGGMDVWPR